MNVIYIVMLQRNVHFVQPYYVGTKDRKSLAVIIPSQIVKDQNIDTSTAFAIRVADDKNAASEIILSYRYDVQTAE